MTGQQIPVEAQAGTPTPERAIPHRRILVVEDDPVLRRANANVLTHSGYAVDVAEDGAAALDAIHGQRYDLLITDNSMPKVSGIELLKILRTARIELPVIMATGTLPMQELTQNPGLGPVAMLEKPYASGQLLELVKTFLSGAPVETATRHDPGVFSVESYTPNCKGEWDAFVSAARNATFLFHRDYMDYHRDRFADHSLMVFHNQALVALLPANLNADGTLVSHDGLTYGGLVVARAATLADVLACFHALLRHLSQNQIARLLFKPIPAFYSTLPGDDVAYALFLLEARLYRRDTSATISMMDRLPLRKGHKCLLKKAANLGIHIVQESSFQPFWERVLIPQLAARHGARPVHSLEEITLLAARFPEQIKQFSAYSDDEIVAGATIYEMPTVAHLQYAAVTEKGRHTGAQAFLFNWLIEQYHDKRYFDFGTSNEQDGRALNHGLLEWKEGFGARCHTHDFYEIATGNYIKLESVMAARRGVPTTPDGTGRISPGVSGTPPAPAYFAHPKALIDEGVSIGKGTRLWAFSHVVNGAILGEDCNVCDHTFIEGAVRVGNRVTIKCGVFLWDGVTVEDDVFIGPGATFTNDNRPRSQRRLKSYPQTVLKRGCTLGAHSTVLPGITVGQWAMVGAGAVVTRDVPDYALVVGNPARFRAWICGCGEKLSPASGGMLKCACGRVYEQIAENEVKELATNGTHQNPDENRLAIDIGRINLASGENTLWR